MGMSEAQSPNTEELAYSLWESQGRPVNRSVDHWLEAEYRAHPMAASQRPNDPNGEIDLRMRGLGPLTQSQSPQENSKHEMTSFIRSVCFVGASLVIAAGLIFSFSQKARFGTRAGR
jgi:hypothetical protein